jgi:predicted nucleic acid-binding protein
MQQATADAELAIVTSVLEILYDSAQVVDELRKLVVKHKIIGKSVHDARLVATMKANGLRSIVTFNSSDFARFQAIEVIDPASAKATAATHKSPKRGGSSGRVPRNL